ncbi:MAG: RNA-binding protein [Clostridiaceae bacterium]
MDKKTFTEKMALSSEMKDIDPGVFPNLYNKIIMAEKTGKTVYSSEFYPPNIWSNLIRMESYFDVSFSTYGIFEDSERRVIGFGSGDFDEFPVKLVKIKTNTKFSAVEHKDYLGSIMSLGIRREKFGDLILSEDACYAAVYEDVAGYLLNNLNKVKNSPCTIEVLDPACDEKPKHRFEFINTTASSQRLDCVTASICSISRTKSDELIRQGKVLVNYSTAHKRDLELDEDDIIVIRGYGKFIFNAVKGYTGSGRLKIELKKFI